MAMKRIADLALWYGPPLVLAAIGLGVGIPMMEAAEPFSAAEHMAAVVLTWPPITAAGWLFLAYFKRRARANLHINSMVAGL